MPDDIASSTSKRFHEVSEKVNKIPELEARVRALEDKIKVIESKIENHDVAFETAIELSTIPTETYSWDDVSEILRKNRAPLLHYGGRTNDK